MNIFLVLSSFPYDKGEAIEIVGHEVVRLMAEAGHHIDVQVLIREDWSKLSEERYLEASASLNYPNISFYPTIYLGALSVEPGAIKRIVNGFRNLIMSFPVLRRKINVNLFPAIRIQPQMERLAKRSNADLILSIWSWEALAATYDIKDIPKFVYYGNPNHKPAEARLGHPDLFDIKTKGFWNRIRYQVSDLHNKATEIQHLKMMNRCEITANNSLVDAEYYRKAGHPHSIYLQNMWPMPRTRPLFGGACSDASPVTVIGSVGNLGATGNTFGLHFIGNDLAPELEKKFGKDGITIEILGGGKPSKAVSSVINRPSIRLRGWVEDIEEEIRHSCAFLVLTNVSGFIVGNTRILLAWSLGACLIAHKNSALSMPEIVHMENALLGESAGEIADLIYSASKDSSLRGKIGRGGYETYLQYYSSDIVVPKMLKEMELLVSPGHHEDRRGVKEC